MHWGLCLPPNNEQAKRNLNRTRVVILLEEMDVDLKHLFNDVQSTEMRKNKKKKKTAYELFCGDIKEVLMDFNEIELACSLCIYDDSEVECIIPSEAEKAPCIIFVESPLTLARFRVFIELYSDVSIKLCNSYAVWEFNVYQAFCQVFYMLLWPTTPLG